MLGASPRRPRLAALPLLAAATLAAAAGPYESHPVLEAKKLLPADQLEAPDYRIEPSVTSQGFLYRFEIVTPSGSFAAERLAQLPVRLREASALAVLAELSAGEVAAESAGDAVEGAVGSVVRVVEEPGETAKGAAGGIGRWAKRTVLGARKLAHDVKEGVEEARQGEPEPDAETDADADPASSDADAPGTAAPAGDSEAGLGSPPRSEPEAESQPNAAGQAAKAVGKFVLGYSGARRNYAAKLGVDPYTRNPVLAAELARVAWSAAAGSFGVGLVLPDLPLAPELQDVYGLVWQLHPRDLEVRNRKLASEWGVDRETRDRFFWNEGWTPTEQTAFVQAIASLGAGPGKRTLIEAAAAASEPAEVDRWVADLQLLARLHAAGTRLARVEGADGFAWASTGRDVLVPFAVDHLVWTPELERALRDRADRIRRSGERHRHRTLAVSGEVSEQARAALAREGWRVSTPKSS